MYNEESINLFETEAFKIICILTMNVADVL